MVEFKNAKTAGRTTLAIADAVSFYCAITIVVLMFTAAAFRINDERSTTATYELPAVIYRRRPCNEIYVVGEGETLHTISDKCGDPFIIEKNPHIHDPDDVFPGLVIEITPSATQ